MPTYVYDRAKGCTVDKATGEPIQLGEFVTPRIHLSGDYKPYRCPITNKVIDGKRAHSENLKLHGCRILEAGETQDSIKERESADRKFEKQIGDAVEKTAAELGI